MGTAGGRSDVTDRDRDVQRQAKALGDPTRHAIFRAVADAPGPVDVAALTGGMVAVGGLAALVLIAQGAGPAALDDVFRYGRALGHPQPL